MAGFVRSWCATFYKIGPDVLDMLPDLDALQFDFLGTRWTACTGLGGRGVNLR